MSLPVLEREDASSSRAGYRNPRELPPMEPDEFWISTTNRNPGAADLSVLFTGEFHRKSRGKWSGPFTGRPLLVRQLMPAIRQQYGDQSDWSLRGLVQSLRCWWRLFDRMEAGEYVAGEFLAPAVHSVEDLTDAHLRFALDVGISRHAYTHFAGVADTTRRALKLKPLYWCGPDEQRRTPNLPTLPQVAAIRNVLKRRWFAVLDRWQKADELLMGDQPRSAAENDILCSYLMFAHVVADTGTPQPTYQQIKQSLNSACGASKGFNAGQMRRLAFPNRADVRVAFMLCQISTGWNVQTLLDYDIRRPDGITPNPKDPTRYVLRSFKARAKADQFYVGMYKTQRSPGVVIQTLVERTVPLRQALQLEFDKKKAQLKTSAATGRNLDEERIALRRLEQGLASPWLYANEEGRIAWLETTNWTNGSSDPSYNSIVAQLNERRPPEDQIPAPTSRTMRAAFANFVYEASGGVVLAVMRELNHRHLSSTQRYLDSIGANRRASRIYLTFANAMWSTSTTTGVVDPTVIAAIVQWGRVTRRERQRLEDYRKLAISRIGVRCKTPTNPPPNVAPGFVADGERKCTSHRCTLCIENAVITPESFDGLCMRWAELMFLKENIAPAVFASTSFQEELENTEAALLVFERGRAEERTIFWQEQIHSGAHIPVTHELIEQGAGEVAVQ